MPIISLSRPLQFSAIFYLCFITSNAEVEFDDLLSIQIFWALGLLLRESDVVNLAIAGSVRSGLQ